MVNGVLVNIIENKLIVSNIHVTLNYFLKKVVSEIISVSKIFNIKKYKIIILFNVNIFWLEEFK
jgi:hypothetical protein